MSTPTNFTTEEIKVYIRELYGLEVTVKPLVSYIDWNFLVTVVPGNSDHSNQSATSLRYVFKIANAAEPLESLDAQNAALEFLANEHADIQVPKVHHTLTGKCIAQVKHSKGQTHYVRMLSFLPGTFMGEMEPAQHSPKLLENLGRFLGTMDKALSRFHHPALYKYLDWDLKNTADLEEFLPDVKDHRKRLLAHHFILQFKTHVLPVMSKLPYSVIHNDANDWNILVEQDETRIAGLIDFGDMIHTFRVAEVAIAMTYAVYVKDDLLSTASYVLQGYHDVSPLTEPELEVLYYLIGARLSTSLVLSAKNLKKNPQNQYLNISVKPAYDTLEKLVSINPDHAADVFRKACGFPVKSRGAEPGEILEVRKRFLGKSLSVSYKKPLKMVRGFMQYLYDHQGRAYLDTVNNVCHVGHCHPRVVAAGQRQMALLNTNTRYLHDNIVQYAQELAATLPDPLNVCFFVCSGSEANELALRMARTHTGQKDFVVLDHAYHGNTNAIVEISPYKFDGPGGSGMPEHVHKAMLPDLFRGPYRHDCHDAATRYAHNVQETFDHMESNGRKAAAFVHESVPGVAGQIVLPDGYLKQAYTIARNHGALCIADEVQIGFGRVGSHMWAFETQGVVPDIVTMGKPIGNGHPLAAVVTTKEIADSFANGMEYFNTFGGNPVSCAIGLEVLRVIKDDGLQENALSVGGYMMDRLRQLMEKHDLIGDVRGLGLFIGIELVRDSETLSPADEEAYRIAELMKEAGVLISVDGPLHNVLKIKPPMVFTKGNADRYVEALDAAISLPGAKLL